MTITTTRPGSAGFRGVDKARRSREIDRTAWADEGRLTVVYETTGSGSVITPPIEFGTIFEGQPFFSYGVSTVDGSPLTSGDFPFVSAGVSEWGITQSADTTEAVGRAAFYHSATLWMAVEATTSYTLHWTFNFGGIVMKSPEHLGPGGVGTVTGTVGGGFEPPPDSSVPVTPPTTPPPPPVVLPQRWHKTDAYLWSGEVWMTHTTDAFLGVPATPGDWGSFPTALNSGWSSWHLDEAPLVGTATYFPPPALPTLPSIPGGAVSVNPSNINSEVASNPAGTSFALANGTYSLTVNTKAGNKYYGNPSNPTAVVIEGNNTRNVAFQGGNANVGLYYITWQHHLGDTNSQSSGAISPGASNWDIRRCTSRWNKFSGIKMSGSGSKLYWHTSYENGQYGVSGPSMDWDLDCLEIYKNGIDGLPAGVTKYSGTDRGACKIGQNITISGTANHVNVRRLHAWGHDDQGWWFDIRIGDATVEYSWIENNKRDGIRFEAGYPSYDLDGPNAKPLIVRWTRLEGNSTKTMNPTNNWWKDWYATPAAIVASVCQNIQVYGNVVIGTRGIGGYNWNHPQLTGEASTPGAGTVNASYLKNYYVHHNYIRSEGGGSNPNNVAAGITNLAGNAYATSSLNRWRDNVYWSPTTRRFNWEPNSGGARTWAQWQAAGHS